MRKLRLSETGGLSRIEITENPGRLNSTLGDAITSVICPTEYCVVRAANILPPVAVTVLRAVCWVQQKVGWSHLWKEPHRG